MIRDTLLFSLLLTTGCRISEITELKVSDINFEDEMITILKKKKNKIQLVIVLRKGFGALLRKYQSVNELRDNECLFLERPKTSLLLDRSQVISLKISPLGQFT